jgi:DeoR family transcriptional regulator of aga operon
VLTDANPLEAEVKRAMIERSRESILLIDESKFDRPGLSAIAPIAAIEAVLVSGGDREQLRALAGTGVRVQELP